MSAYGLSISFFEPFKSASDECGDNGLPVCPATTKILGNGKLLILKDHPGLEELVHIEKGKRDRIIVVTSKLNEETRLDKVFHGPMKADVGLPFAQQLFGTLDFLHKSHLVHRSLTPQNIYYNTEEKKLKIRNWFFWSLSNCGTLAPFDYKSNLKYLAPEDLIKIITHKQAASHQKSDIFAAGIILLELVLGIKLWKNKKSARQLIQLKLQIAKDPNFSNLAEAIVAQLGLSSHFQAIDSKLLKIITTATSHKPSERPNAEEILEILNEEKSKKRFGYDLFDIKPVRMPEKVNAREILSRLPGRDIFSLWKLSSSDLYSELEKGELIRKRPALADLQLIPTLTKRNNEGEDNQDSTHVSIDLSLESLEGVLEDFDGIAANPVTIDIDQSALSATLKRINDEKRLPLPIRESSIIYQLHRMLLYRHLLTGYPRTRDLIIEQAKIDICPNLRGYVWSALLGVKGDTKGVYSRIDKCSRRETDRQIEVDIPRCHQYEPLISCPEGAHKLKRVIKAWLVTNPKLTYWQGLDSLTVPFVVLHYDREDLAFATMTKFIPKYLTGLFQRDNARVIQEYLAVFQQLLCHHDPELSNHLADMDGQAFVPDLYAIPWFLTMFAHVFPINKIIHLWDTMLLFDSSFPLFIGVATMLRLKRQLLSFSFNDCILSFSDMPDIDIHDVIKSSIKLERDTPKSCSFRVFQPEPDPDGILGMNPEFIDISARRMENVPRISAADICRISGTDKSVIVGTETGEQFEVIDEKDFEKSAVVDRVLVVDIRSEEEFKMGTLPGAVSIPADLAFEDPSEDQPFGSLKSSNVGAINLITARGKSIIVIAAETTEAAQGFVLSLLKLGYSRLCVLNGGFEHLLQIGATLRIPEI